MTVDYNRNTEWRMENIDITLNVKDFSPIR